MNILPNGVLEMRRKSVASITVVDGSFATLVTGDTAIAKIAPDGVGVPPGDTALVVTDPQSFKIFSGATVGRTTITASTPVPGGGTASITVVVKTFFSPPAFVAGVNHGHQPSGRYADVQAHPNSPGVTGFVLENACRLMDPLQLVNFAKGIEFTDKPIALKHLDWYLTNGHGKDFVEDDNIRDWLTRDSGIKSRLRQEIFPSPGVRKANGHFSFDQGGYAIEDFKYAFGAIDRVDFEVDFGQDTVRVWFQDRYEWHPVYPFYTFLPGDVVRETNCLHAALVELKSSGAADYWMVGQAEAALSMIAAP